MASIPDDQVEGREASKSDAPVLEGRRQQQQQRGQEALDSDGEASGRQQALH